MTPPRLPRYLCSLCPSPAVGTLTWTSKQRKGHPTRITTLRLCEPHTTTVSINHPRANWSPDSPVHFLPQP